MAEREAALEELRAQQEQEESAAGTNKESSMRELNRQSPG